jgi:hypothetical protein
MSAEAVYWIRSADFVLIHGPRSAMADFWLSAAAYERLAETTPPAEVRLLADALLNWTREQDPERAGRWRAVVVACRDLALTVAPTWVGRDGIPKPDIEGRHRT